MPEKHFNTNFVRQLIYHFPPSHPKQACFLIKGRYLHGVIYRHCEKNTTEVAGPVPVVPLNSSSNCDRDRVTL